MKLNKIL